MAFSPDGKLLAGGSDDRSIRLWDPATGAQLNTLTGHEDVAKGSARRRPRIGHSILPLQPIENSGNRKSAFSVSAVRRLTDGLLRHPRHERGVNSVAFSPDGKLLAGGSADRSIRLWDPATGAQLNVLTGHEFGVNSVAFSPDGKLLAGASSDRSIRLWDPATGAQVQVLTVHESDVNSVAFSPDGKRLASASADRSIHLWDPATGVQLYTLTGHERSVNSVAFSPDGKLLASASDDGSIRLWGGMRVPILLLNGPAPSPRAALISEALQRLWRLRLDGLDIRPEDWAWLQSRDGYYVDQEFDIDVRPAAATADPNSEPILRTFDIRPLLDPPPPGQDKLDQLLDWVAEQEPRLTP